MTIAGAFDIFLLIQIALVVLNWKLIIFCLITGSFWLTVLALRFKFISESKIELD